MIPHSCKLEDLIQQLNTDHDNGLSSAQVQKLLQEHGENRLKEGKKRPTCRSFWNSLKT